MSASVGARAFGEPLRTPEAAMFTPRPEQKPSLPVARAMYDNVAETPDELAFRKGDVLYVLEQNTSGLEGWWLCMHRGRQGICPANRLRLIPLVYDTGAGMPMQTSRSDSSHASPVHSSTRPKYESSSSISSSWSSASSTSAASARSAQPREGLLGAAVRANQQQRATKVSSRAGPVPDAHSLIAPASMTNLYSVGHLPNQQLVMPIRQGNAFAYPGQDCYDEPRALSGTASAHRSPRPVPEPCHGVAHADYDVPRQHNPNKQFINLPANSEYDVPRPSDDVYDTPRPTTTSEQYDVPAPVRCRSNDLSDRSSGVSLFSSGSSDLSCGLPAHLSASSESLSLSTAGRSSRSSAVIDHQPTSFELYDVPPAQRRQLPIIQQEPRLEETYDVPKPVASEETYDVPPPPSAVVADVYDVPRTNAHEPAPVNEETYDNPKADGVKLTGTLPLAPDAAMETLGRLEAEVSSAVTSLVTSWRSETDWAELQLRVLRLRSSLQELCDFTRGAIGNAAQRIKNGEKDDGVAIGLARLLVPLHNANNIVQRTTQGWTDLVATSRRRPDSSELEQLVACCRNLGDDMRQVVTFIRTNGRVLFANGPGVTLDDQSEPRSSTDDYDYVSLEPKAKYDQDNEEVKRSLPHDMKGTFDVLVAQSEDLPVLPSVRDQVSDNDRNVIEFYGSQADTYTVYLGNAIDAFILTIERSQPPKVFVAYSKFVILNAHKLLCIGDTVHRNVANAKLKATVLERSNHLCQGLQTCVQSTKRAGKEFPSVSAVQGMLDSVLAVSKLAHQLKSCLVQPIIQK